MSRRGEGESEQTGQDSYSGHKRNLIESRSGAKGGLTAPCQGTDIQAVTASFSPSFSIEISRILYFWTLPVIVIGNSSTIST